jgi:hypothetical protein
MDHQSLKKLLNRHGAAMVLTAVATSSTTGGAAWWVYRVVMETLQTEVASLKRQIDQLEEEKKRLEETAEYIAAARVVRRDGGVELSGHGALEYPRYTVSNPKRGPK